MTIRKKTLCVIFSLFLFMGLIIYIVTRFVLISGYLELETKDMIKTTGQVSKEMEDGLVSLKKTVNDWAPWNDTYQFIQELNDFYIQNNLMSATISNLNINFMLFVNNDGKIKYTRVVDPENETALEGNNDDYARLLEENPILLRSEDLKESVSGYALFDDKIVRFASAPIMTSQFQGPVMGTLVIGNYIDSREIGNIEEKLKVPLKINRIEPGKSVDFFLKNETLSQGNQFLINRSDRTTITSSILFENLSKKPLYILEMEKRRDIYLQGLYTLNSLLLALGIISLFFMTAMIVFLEKTILYRLLELSKDVKKITLKGHREKSVILSGKDEISSLSMDINQMIEKLWENEKRYQTLFESAGDAILLLNESIIVDCNLKALEFFQCEKSQVIGKSPCFFSPERQPDGELSTQKLDDFIETFFAKGSLLFEWIYSKKNKTVFETEMNLTHIDLPSGAHIQVIIRDISERRQAEADQEKLQAQLVQSRKMETIGTLAGGIAHDFNNILSGILGYTQLAEMNLGSPVKVRSYLSQIIKGAHRAADLTQQILIFSRQTEYEKRPITLYLVLKEALKLLRSSIPSTIDITEAITSRSKILADPTQMHQVIMNLCTNAYHAMGEIGGMLTVRLNEKQVSGGRDVFNQEIKEGLYLELEVTDTGHGMGDEILKKAFDPYFTTKGIGKGTGFGLALVHAIVEEHGGHIKVHSRVGKGTGFYIYLPVIADQDASRQADIKNEKPYKGGSERLMVVDDEEDIRMILQDFLTTIGYKVSIFANGTRAFEAFQEDPDQFDLIVTDMTMPQMTGGELAKKIISIRENFPIILCTGYSETVSEAHALEIGISRYLMKPVSNNDLAISIREILDEIE